ncbi:MAG: glycerol-3-phosphate dehydrogenase, partial [Erysipelotrichaceae bacterium]|nr:glycerol-3-phosphate dehydrogenase [Erysipelotrichaceae bacterium]
ALHGLKLGENAKASLLTRGLAEMSRFAVAKGARIETFMGLCGMGDLILTCTSPMSRNFTAGYQIGKENSSEGFWKQNKSTVEGVAACKIIAEEARKEGISMPITEQVYEILFNLKRPSDALKDLMSRDLKPEIHD